MPKAVQSKLMKRFHAFLPATALFIGLAGCSAGTSTTAGGDNKLVAIPAEGIDFNIVAKKGDVVNYQAKMTMDAKGPAQAGMPGEFKVDADMKQTVTVTSVEGGNFVLETAFSDVKVTGTQMFADAIKTELASKKSTVTVDKKGRVIEQAGAMDANSMAGGTLYFPDKKVKIGDTWERSTPMPNGGSVSAKYKFEGTEELDGVDVARITVTPSSPDAKSTGSFTYWIDIATAMAIKANGKITTEADGGRMVMTMDIKRILTGS